MSGNTFGTLFTVTTFGESHGPAIGCVIDGCPPGMPLDESDIQPDLDRRRPGTSRHVTQRNEPDAVEILSGVYEGLTTGNALSVDALAGASADALADSLTSFFGVGLESKPEKRLVSDL